MISQTVLEITLASKIPVTPESGISEKPIVTTFPSELIAIRAELTLSTKGTISSLKSVSSGGLGQTDGGGVGNGVGVGVGSGVGVGVAAGSGVGVGVAAGSGVGVGDCSNIAKITHKMSAEVTTPSPLQSGMAQDNPNIPRITHVMSADVITPS